jgi:hypothetical protein
MEMAKNMPHKTSGMFTRSLTDLPFSSNVTYESSKLQKTWKTINLTQSTVQTHSAFHRSVVDI